MVTMSNVHIRTVLRRDDDVLSVSGVLRKWRRRVINGALHGSSRLVITARYRSAHGACLHFRNRTARVMPVRVGRLCDARVNIK